MASKSTINITFKLDGDSKGFKDLAQQADGLKVVMQSAAVEAEKFQASVINWSQGVQALGAISNAVGNLNNTLTSITSESMAFSKAMRSANTMAGYGAEDFDKLKGKVADLAKEIPIARDELARGLYMVISNGVPEDNWISFLEASARSSVGGLSDLSEAVTVTSTIIKNYGLAWEDAQSIQDKIQLTAKNGVTSFEQLAGALPSVAGSAASLGVSIDELMSVFATCTGVTGNTAEVATQLNAVLKALIKPTSEASAAAEKLGIQFDAAAVKEAGSLDAFLKSVDSAISTYSARTGELSETIYGNLFGSSRALRLLTSLTGEQADKFTENIGVMVDSAGTMDAAYEEMSQTVSAQSQIFQNYINSMVDVVASVIAPYQPLMNLVAQFGQMSLSVVAIVKSLSMARTAITTLVTIVKTASVAVGIFTTSEGRAAVAAQGWRTATIAATASTQGLSLAIKGLLASTGIGLAIAAITTLILKLTSATKEADETIEEFKDTSEDAFKDTMVNTQAEISNEIRHLDDLIKAHKDTSKAVQDLNSKYGDIFGTYKTAQEWKDTLTKSSKTYCEQLAYEAKMLELNKQLIDLQFEGNELMQQRTSLQDQSKLYAGVGGGLTKEGRANAEEIKKNGDEQERVNRLIDECSTHIENLHHNLESTRANTGRVATAMGGVEKATSSANKAVEQQKTRIQEINEAINKLTENYVNASDEQRESIQISINGLNEEKAAIELVQAQASRPISLDSLKDIDAEISYQQKLLKTATKEEAQDILQVIDSLQEEKKAYTELNETPFEPVALADVKNIQECTDAIDYYTDKQKTASAEEYGDLQKIINGYEAKSAAIQRSGDLLDMQNEIDSYSGLSTRELRIKVREEGMSDFVDKINSLRGMLNDEINPVSDEQRQEIEKLIDAYTRLARQSALSFGTLKDGWSSIKGIGSGVDDITSALTEDGNAWEKVTGIIDGFIEIYEGISKVITIIEALTMASVAHGTAKVVEGTETEGESAIELAAAAEQAAAAAIATPALQMEAAAWEELAAAQIFAAHAYIPFAGVAIAGAMIAVMEGVLAGVGAIGMFAEGGIAYGPTLGLFGEYAGASTNPEVVAPLDRLRSLLRTDDEMGSGRVRFTIEGRTLVGVLEKEYAVRSRR